MKIFLLEDDFALNKIITKSLNDKGYYVYSCHDGYKAVNIVLDGSYDLYILDLNVLGFSGHKILELIRDRDKQSPVIIISAQIDISKIRESYNLGCNDYIKKPFDFEELYLRIQYHLSHETKKNDDLVDIGNSFSFDKTKKALFHNEKNIDLSIKEKLLLNLLVNNINEVVSIEMIHEYVWNGKQIEAVSMRSMIHKLKKQLKSAMIVNIRGEGYKLIRH
jgi:DNA-binding response OmpR family regulator